MIGDTKVYKFVEMKVFEILNFNREPLKRLQQAGIRIEDVEYIDLNNDYRMMFGGIGKADFELFSYEF
nr:MAG TPA: hypothetical protein [Caudoviricetes sp.]